MGGATPSTSRNSHGRLTVTSRDEQVEDIHGKRHGPKAPIGITWIPSGRT